MSPFSGNMVIDDKTAIGMFPDIYYDLDFLEHIGRRWNRGQELKPERLFVEVDNALRQVKTVSGSMDFMINFPRFAQPGMDWILLIYI